MDEDFERRDYTIRVTHGSREPNPYKWQIFRAGRHAAVKRAASVYRTAEKCRLAGEQALKEILGRMADRKKKRNG
jgi:hypothetical protein